MDLKEKGKLFVLSSPSGVGKTTLTRKLVKNNSNFIISISHTTRKPRPGELNKKDYYFVNKNEFNSLLESNNFFEHAEIFNNYYGTLKEPVLNHISLGKDVLFDIDWQGTQQLKKVENLALTTFFILPPNIQALKSRLFNRHKGQENLIEQRMKKFNEEISHWKEYDYIFVNDDLEECYNSILNIITSKKKGIEHVQKTDDIEKKVKELIQ